MLVGFWSLLQRWFNKYFMSQHVGDLEITGALRVLGAITGSLSKSNIPVVQNSIFELPFANLRVWDAFATLLPATPAADDLGLVNQVFGSGGPPYVSAGDVKASSSTRRARFTYHMPIEYVAGRDASIRLHAGMLTTVAGTSCVVDLEAFLIGIDTAYDGVDLITSAAQSINSLTFAPIDFVLDTGNGLAPGDFIDVRVSVTWVDAATVTAVIPAIAKSSLICTTRA